jgi:hypothetical protein
MEAAMKAAIKTIPATEATTIETISVAEAKAAEPWASADEDATHEVVGAIVTVWSARIGSIRVVAPIANGSGIAAINRANSYAYRELRAGRGRSRKNAKTKQSQIP